MATANPFIDTRGEIKCANFDGRDENRPQWVVKFESYTELTGVGIEMENAATYTGSLALNTFGVRFTQVARALYAVLVSKCEGKALASRASQWS